VMGACQSGSAAKWFGQDDPQGPDQGVWRDRQLLIRDPPRAGAEESQDPIDRPPSSPVALQIGGRAQADGLEY